MDMDLILQAGALRRDTQAQTLARINRASAPFGLVLSEAALARLEAAHGEALRDARRLEWGESLVERAARAFCDSPCVSPREWEQTLAELVDLFGALQNECRGRLTDDELLAALRLLFDGPCGGSLTALQQADPDLLVETARTGRADAWLRPDETEKGYDDGDRM